MLVDAVSLQHFGAIGRMSLMLAFLRVFEAPHWTHAVRSEILAGIDHEACAAVLSCAELGPPLEVPSHDLGEVMRLQVSLGGGGASGTDHLGEAETLVMADRRHCGVITDDNSAHAMFERRLGPERVHDSVDVLRWCVAAGLLTPGEAKAEADAIRNVGRHLRRVHPSTFRNSDFEPR